MEDLADMLAMYATQIRESARGEGDPPHPNRLDDWLIDYRHRYQALANGGDHDK
jgi:hypothetical protein